MKSLLSTLSLLFLLTSCQEAALYSYDFCVHLNDSDRNKIMMETGGRATVYGEALDDKNTTHRFSFEIARLDEKGNACAGNAIFQDNTLPYLKLSEIKKLPSLRLIANRVVLYGSFLREDYNFERNKDAIIFSFDKNNVK